MLEQLKVTTTVESILILTITANFQRNTMYRMIRLNRKTGYSRLFIPSLAANLNVAYGMPTAANI